MHPPPSGYRELADLIRAQIEAGELLPGQQLPSEAELMQRYGLAHLTVRRAVGLLRNEGLIDVQRGYRSRVRESPDVQDVPLPAGVRVTARMPTPAERFDLQIPEGVPVLMSPDVLDEEGRPRVFPADRFRLRPG